MLSGDDGILEFRPHYLSQFTLQSLIDHALPQPELEDLPIPE